MLRVRLLYGLLTLVLLLWSVGATALLLMRDASKRFDERLTADYAAIEVAQSFRTLTSTINSRYVPVIGDPEVQDRLLFDNSIAEIRRNLERLRAERGREEHWQSVADRMDSAIEVYSQGYETYFNPAAPGHSDRKALLNLVAGQTQRITDLAGNFITLAGAKLFSGVDQMREDARKNVFFVATLVFLGTSIAVTIYFQLVRHLVDPVMGLRRSIEEVRKGNFELSLPIPDKNSEFTPVVAAFNDMAAELKSRRGETDEHLMRASLVNRAILEAIPSPVFVLGDDTAIVQINPSAEILCEKLGVSGRLPLKIQRILNDCRASGNHFLPEDPREALLFRINEEEFYYLPRIFRFASDDKAPGGWAVLLHNVSRIRWLDDMKTNLISTVSHEIKTPLTGIRMVLHLLLEERSGKLDKMQKTMVSSANDDCERLLATLNSLLDLSRAESGATHLSRAPMALFPALERVARLYAGAATEKNVRFEVPRPTMDLPEVHADPVGIDEVLNNLVSNAIKHSPRGGAVGLKVTKLDAENLRVHVTDQGPGVPEASQDRIFERFFRAPGQNLDGVGLGLFISREIMRAHEGRIGLSERANDKTEFYIDVPIA